METIIIIPARMASTRLPGKPLADICGLPMIEHVRRRACLANFIDKVVVATCDKEIYDVVVRNGGDAVMTSPTHPVCIDRTAEAVRYFNADVVLLVQGDEPLVQLSMIKTLYTEIGIRSCDCVNLMTRIKDEEEWRDVDNVKVVVDCYWDAMYFSRQPIGGIGSVYKQLGLLAFRGEFLEKFLAAPRGLIEEMEKIDLLRALEMGLQVHMCPDEGRVVGVDNQRELEEVRELMVEDPLFKRGY